MSRQSDSVVCEDEANAKEGADIVAQVDEPVKRSIGLQFHWVTFRSPLHAFA